MLRNQMGMDFAGTNTAREGYDLAPMEAGEVVESIPNIDHRYGDGRAEVLLPDQTTINQMPQRSLDRPLGRSYQFSEYLVAHGDRFPADSMGVMVELQIHTVELQIHKEGRASTAVGYEVAH